MTSSVEREERLIKLLRKGVNLGGIAPNKFEDGHEFYKIEFCAIDAEVRIGIVLLREKEIKDNGNEIPMKIIEVYEIKRGKTNIITNSKLCNKNLIFRYTHASYNTGVQYMFGELKLPKHAGVKKEAL